MREEYKNLTAELRRLSIEQRNIAQINGMCSKDADTIANAASVIESLGSELDKFADAAFKLSQERDALEKRLRHLLESKTICKYDELWMHTGNYILDIAQLDEDMQRLEYLTADHSPAPAVSVGLDRATTRADILQRAAECVSGQREDDYGKPEDNFAKIADLWTAYSGYPFNSVDVAMMMALLKIARVSSGHGSEDSFVDLAGYAACGGEIYARRQAESESGWSAELTEDDYAAD